MTSAYFDSWLAAVLFPEHQRVTTIAIVNNDMMPSLFSRLGHHAKNLVRQEFSDSRHLTQLYRYLHPTTYEVGVDTSVASLVLGIKQQPNIAVLRDNSSSLLAQVSPEIFARTGFVMTAPMLDPQWFDSRVDAVAAALFPDTPAIQRHRLLHGQILPTPLAGWLQCPDARPIIIESPQIQRMIHDFPHAMSMEFTGKPYTPDRWIIFRGVYQLLRLAEQQPDTFAELTRLVPYVIVNEEPEQLTHLNVVESVDIRNRLDSYCARFRKATVIMCNHTKDSQKRCDDPGNDLGCVWVTFKHLQQTHKVIAASSAGGQQPPPTTIQMSTTSEARHFNSMIALLSKPMLAGDREAGEQQLRATMNRSAQLWPHERELIHTHARINPDTGTYHIDAQKTV